MLWLTGIVLAKGFWPTFFAVLVPIYSWFLVAATLVDKYF